MTVYNLSRSICLHFTVVNNGKRDTIVMFPVATVLRVGGLIVVVSVIVIVVVVVVCCRRRRKRRQERNAAAQELRVEYVNSVTYDNIKNNNIDDKDTTPSSSKHKCGYDAFEEPPSYTGPEQDFLYPVYVNVPMSIKVDRLREYVLRRTTKDYRAEFMNLPQKLSRPFRDSQNPWNVDKNTFDDIYPYDFSRVKIEGDSYFYMNACYIDGYNCKDAYIASTGPTRQTTENFTSFWKMVWYHNCDVIVMLTNLQENGVIQCEQYWPDLLRLEKIGDYMITCISEDIYVHFVHRVFHLSQGSEVHVVNHLQYTTWTDGELDEDIIAMVEFQDKANDLHSDSRGPVVVHCDAGVGRTGIYIALDRLTREGKETGSVNVFRCVMKMREQRVNMVESLKQYEHLHRCLVLNLTSCCDIVTDLTVATIVSCATDNFYTNIRQLLEEDMIVDIDEICAKEQNREINGVNRKGADVPGHRWRPRLPVYPGVLEREYINAVGVDSATKANTFIIAQTPLPGTMQDFISLIYHSSVACVVALDDGAYLRKDVGEYLPLDTREVKHGPFKVSRSRAVQEKQFVGCDMGIRLAQMVTEEKTIHHLKYTSWDKDESVPNDAKEFVEFIKYLDTVASTSSQGRQILVHCITGAERSALFCAVSILIEELKIHRKVNVLNTLRKIKIRRNGAFLNKSQVKFCFDCLDVAVHYRETEENIYHNIQTLK